MAHSPLCQCFFISFYGKPQCAMIGLSFSLHFQYDYQHVKGLSDRLIKGIESQLTHVIRNGDPEHSYPGCVNLSFAYVEGESLLMALKDIALSSGR